MFYTSDEELIRIIKKTGTTIVVGRLDENFVRKNFKGAFIIKPGTMKNESAKVINSITPDQIREVISLSKAKQQIDQYFFFDSSEKMQEAAEDAALKLFEEPKDNYHFVLYTSSPEALLQTIRSRATILAPLKLNRLEDAPGAEEEVKTMARRLLVSNPNQVIEISDEINKFKEKNGVTKRDFALNIIATTIEIAEKSFFKTKNEAFLKKIDGLILAYDAIKNNCNLRLQLVANLI